MRYSPMESPAGFFSCSAMFAARRDAVSEPIHGATLYATRLVQKPPVARRGVTLRTRAVGKLLEILTKNRHPKSRRGAARALLNAAECGRRHAPRRTHISTESHHRSLTLDQETPHEIPIETFPPRPV